MRLGGGGGVRDGEGAGRLCPWFTFPSFLQFVLKNYGENPEAYNEELKKLELLRQVGGEYLYEV